MPDETPAAGGDTPSGGQAFTQQQVDQIVGERLARERAKLGDIDALKQKASEYDKLAEQQKTEAQKTQERIAALEGENTSLKGRTLRYEVATAKGLDPKWAPRLSGSTKEELEKDAEALAKELGGTRRTTFDGGARDNAPPQGGMDAIIRRRAGRS